MMSGSIKKRSLTLDGHQTSISLEDDFWNALREIANLEEQSVTTLISNIDRNRSASNVGLSSAIRLFILNFYREKAKAEHRKEE